MKKIFGSVLLVEDDGAHALIIGRALRSIGEEVHQAASLADALSILGSAKIDLIVTDLHLPDSGATGPLPVLSSSAPGVPIVVLTASTALEDAVEAMRQGARDFIVKSFDGNFTQVLALSLSRLVGVLEMERERLRLEREMEVLRISIENTRDGLVLLDERGAILYSNRSFSAFAAACGVEPKAISDLFTAKIQRHEAARDTLIENIATLPAGATWTTELIFAEDKAVAFELSLTTLPTPGKRCFALWTRNRTQEKRREKFQREILSTTTHDLKGPLGAILISSELLQGMVPSEGKPHDLILRIASSAQGAVNLIDEFLSARRIQEGTFILRPSAHDIAALTEEALADFRTIATARGITLAWSSSGGEISGCVDKLGYVRVVSNLVSNAIKFTQRGGTVTVAVKRDGDEIHLLVQDTGSGIEPSDVQRLFERYSRLEQHSEVAGTGLGLFVVKSVVTAHNGRIDVTSKVGEGTKFDVVFPRNPPMNERGELISLNFA